MSVFTFKKLIITAYHGLYMANQLKPIIIIFNPRKTGVGKIQKNQRNRKKFGELLLLLLLLLLYPK